MEYTSDNIMILFRNECKETGKYFYIYLNVSCLLTAEAIEETYPAFVARDKSTVFLGFTMGLRVLIDCS